jgi:MoxR-like ATPase
MRNEYTLTTKKESCPVKNEATDKDLIGKVIEAEKALKTEIAKVIVGQERVIEELLLSIFVQGHCLIVGVPGLAKTLLVSTLAKALDLQFNRIQFTPDLMPSDVTGTEVIQEDKATRERHFKFVPGPVFSNVLLADEINRTPPKTQAALLQAMQERKVTFWPHKIRLNRRGPIRSPKPNWTASFSKLTLAILLSRRRKQLLKRQPNPWRMMSIPS